MHQSPLPSHNQGGVSPLNPSRSRDQHLPHMNSVPTLPVSLRRALALHIGLWQSSHRCAQLLNPVTKRTRDRTHARETKYKTLNHPSRPFPAGPAYTRPQVRHSIPQTTITRQQAAYHPAPKGGTRPGIETFQTTTVHAA